MLYRGNFDYFMDSALKGSVDKKNDKNRDAWDGERGGEEGLTKRQGDRQESLGNLTFIQYVWGK